MPRKKVRNYSLYTKEACRLLGMLIRNARKEKRMSVEELAERASTSPNFVRRVEKGGLTGEIGVAFELAFIVGVPLFQPENADTPNPKYLKYKIVEALQKEALLPQSARKPKETVKDDF